MSSPAVLITGAAPELWKNDWGKREFLKIVLSPGPDQQIGACGVLGIQSMPKTPHFPNLSRKHQNCLHNCYITVKWL